LFDEMLIRFNEMELKMIADVNWSKFSGFVKKIEEHEVHIVFEAQWTPLESDRIFTIDSTILASWTLWYSWRISVKLSGKEIVCENYTLVLFGQSDINQTTFEFLQVFNNQAQWVDDWNWLDRIDSRVLWIQIVTSSESWKVMT
jgi:hypothetical protein